MNDKTADTTPLADELLALARRVADRLEALDDANQSMRSASLGVLPDGTPVEDMMSELREVKADIARLHGVIRQVKVSVELQGVRARRGHRRDTEVGRSCLSRTKRPIRNDAPWSQDS